MTAPGNNPQIMSDGHDDGISTKVMRKLMKKFSDPAFFEWNQETMSTVINKKLKENDFKYRTAANLFTRDASSDVYKTFEKLAVSQKHITMYTHSGTHDKNN